MPLLRNGKLTASSGSTALAPANWGEHEVSVLVDVAGQLAIVLANAAAREQRARAERDLRNRDAILERDQQLGRALSRPSRASTTPWSS